MAAPTSPVEIRPVALADVPQVVATVRDVLAEFGLVFGQGSDTDRELARLPDSYTARGGAFWVAARDREIAGTCGVFPVAERVYELRKMYLLPSARGLGAGQRLLDEAIAWAKSAGGERMVLDTVHAMERAIALYEKNGFSRDDAQIRGARCSRGYCRVL